MKKEPITANVKIIHDSLDNTYYIEINDSYPIRISKKVAHQLEAQLTKTKYHKLT